VSDNTDLASNDCSGNDRCACVRHSAKRRRQVHHLFQTGVPLIRSCHNSITQTVHDRAQLTHPAADKARATLLLAAATQHNASQVLCSCNRDIVPNTGSRDSTTRHTVPGTVDIVTILLIKNALRAVLTAPCCAADVPPARSLPQEWLCMPEFNDANERAHHNDHA
jgi:hypothetical protein